MSLTRKQLQDTARALRENLEKSGLTIEQAAAGLETTPDYIERMLRMEPRRYEDTWILKNYLSKKAQEAGKTPTPIPALGGDYHVIWFLDAAYIDGGKIRSK